MRQNLALVAFNRGLISKLALARADVKRVAMAAEVFENYVVRALGAMMIRPGLGYIAPTKANAACRGLPFVFATSDVARIELTNITMRVFVSDTLITRVAVGSAVANGNFNANLTSWTDNDEAGGVSAWVTGGYMGLTGNGSAAAIRDQQVTVLAADQNIEHALKIVIERGPVTLRVGSTAGGDEYIGETDLDTGMHSLAFTPTGDFFIRLLSRLKRQVLVDSCNVEGAGAMELATPWTTADLDYVVGGQEQQSGDIIFCAARGTQQRKIERRATRSWSVVKYYANDGPFRDTNIGPITITPSALSGNITLTASAALFKSTNVGGLYRVTSNGQQVSASVTAQNQFTNAIRVIGTGNQRVFTVTIDEDAAGNATFTLQRSLDSESGPWTDVLSQPTDYTATFDDALSNQIAWYRLGVKTGDYVNGTHAVSLAYTVGSIDGIVRVTAFTTSVLVDAEVLTDLGGTSATDDWAEGTWSDRRGWPSAGAFYEGRLFWAGKNGIFGSVSDGFYSFDATVEGDSGPIDRTIGAGPVDNINWLLPLQRLILGAEGAEFSCRASSIDEILTPTNFNIKPASNQGSAGVQAAKIDSRGIFVQRGGTRVFELDLAQNGVDYGSEDLTLLVPEVCKPRVVRVGIQRQPDTRIHCVLSNGTVAILVYNKLENVTCWLNVTSTGAGGLIEDVVVLPGASGSDEDQVYYTVKRTINGATVRYHEKWAKEEECRLDANGALTLCKLGDSFVTYTGATVNNLPAGTASHLAGKQVVVWADGADVGSVDNSDGSVSLTYTVTAGGVLDANLPVAAGNIMVGLPYTARFKSGKLVALATQLGTPLNQHKQIKGLGLCMADVHRRGVQFGKDFTHLDDLPSMEEGAAVDDNAIREAYDEPVFPFGGDWDTDSRLCLQSRAPRPCVILAATMEVQVVE